MADDQKRIKRLMIERTTLVDGLLSVLERKVEDAERSLLKQTVEQFMDKLDLTPEGRVRSTLYNKRLLATIDNVFKKFGKTDGVAIASTIASGVASVSDFSGKYYSTFASKAQLLPIQKSVKETTAAWLGIGAKGGVEPNGYLDTIINDSRLRNEIKDFALRTVVGQQGWMEAKQQLSELLVGTEEKAGKMKQYYRNFVYDTYSQVDRATAEIYADQLGFQFYIYEGGIIKTSRKFCRDKNGKVFHKSEIQKFDPKVARPPGYNPFTDLGGYGCRHHLNGIPDILAYILRPDAKQTFGGGAAPIPTPTNKQKQVEQPPQPQSQPKVEPKKTEAPKPKAPTKTEANKDPVIKTVKDAKSYLSEIIKPFAVLGKESKILISSTLTTEQVKQYSLQVGKLFTDYRVEAPGIEELRFKSTAGKYGAVSAYITGRIKYANFGDKVDIKRGLEIKEPANRVSTQSKSRVDEDKTQISTATHEFAHVLSLSQTIKSENATAFFTEIRGIRKQYHDEINKKINNGDIEGAAAIYLGRYAGTNIDEFWAESFTEYKLKTNPSKYAKIVGEIGDKYFKKK